MHFPGGIERIDKYSGRTVDRGIGKSTQDLWIWIKNANPPTAALSNIFFLFGGGGTLPP
jgi:hypothetical protein